MINLMNYGQIIPIFDQAQARLKDYFRIVDTRVAILTKSFTLSEDYFWDNGFEVFIKKYLGDREKDMCVQALVAQVGDRGNANTIPEQKAEKANHQAWVPIFERY
jgi:hypothetical protein